VRSWLYLLALLAILRTEAGEPPLAEVPFEFRDGLIWVPVAVPQLEKPLNFLVDSGAQVSVINQRTAHELGLREGRRVRVRGVHTVTEGRWPVQLAARVDGFSLPQKYLALDLDKLGEACHCRVDGLLGADFFSDRIVELDFATRRIRLLTTPRELVGGASLPLDIRASGMRVPVGINGGKPAWVRLDTGCAAALHWVTALPQGREHPSQIAVGLVELSIPAATATVQLGGTTFEGVPVGLHEREIFVGEAGLLGNGLLSRFTSVTVDTKAGRLILRK
jgi:hypothetical protein